jgi:heme/copper-type cytochrome/quinol oxidase subunit 3
MSQAGSEIALAAGPRAPNRVGTAGMWTFLATDAMGFGGLFIAYAVLRVRAETWPEPRTRLALAPVAAMTFALLLSSLTMTLAVRAERGRARAGWLGATLALGLAFLVGELLEYRHLWTAAVPMRVGGDLFAATFYLLTGYHGLHVLAGVVCLSAAWLGRAGQRTLEVVALYWHFVDLAWMPIFTFLYLLPAR